MRSLLVFFCAVLLCGCAPKKRLHQDPELNTWESSQIVWTSPYNDLPVFFGNGVVGLWVGRDGTGDGQTASLASKLTPDGRDYQRFRSPLSLDFRIEGRTFLQSDVNHYRQIFDPSKSVLSTTYEVQDQVFVESKLTFENPNQPSRIKWTFTVTGIKPADIQVNRSLSHEVVTAFHCSDQFVTTAEETQRDNFKLKRNTGISVTRFIQTDTVPHFEPLQVRIQGSPQDADVLNLMLWQLRMGVNPIDGTAPFGLSNSKYGARVFWDSDIWMFSALSLVDPERASAITRFRTKHFDQAIALAIKLGGARYPWETGMDGSDKTVTDSQKQMHISGDVARSLRIGSELGLVDSQIALKIEKECGKFLAKRATRRPDGKWTILDTMSPDEFHIGDSDLYTNILAEQVLRQSSPESWQEGSFVRPKDAQTFLTYDGDKLKNYKQAAALLALWPLQDPACERQAKKMMDRFIGKSTPNGPAMSGSIEALLMARFGSPDGALAHWRKGNELYSKRPLMMFSEAPNGKNAVFLTGLAGSINAVIYGFLGFRIDDHDPGDVPWKVKLKGHFWLSCKPHLPRAWSSVTIEPLIILGSPFRFELSTSRVKAKKL